MAEGISPSLEAIQTIDNKPEANTQASKSESPLAVEPNIPVNGNPHEIVNTLAEGINGKDTIARSIASQGISSPPDPNGTILHAAEVVKQALGVPLEQEHHRQNIHELKIAVHTLWGAVDDLPDSPLQRLLQPILHRKAYNERQALHSLRKQVFDHTVKAFIPDREDDVFLYMPWVGKEFGYLRHTVKAFQQEKRIDKNVLFWTDLYKAIKEQSPSRNNVVLGPDLVFDYHDPTILTDKLAKKNFEITEQTTITIGGEYMELCMQAASEEILKLPQVKKLRVDKKASLQQDYDKGKPFVTDKLKQSYERRGFLVSEDDNYVYVSKNH